MFRHLGWKLWATSGLFVVLAIAPLSYPLVARIVFICAAALEALFALSMRQIIARASQSRSASQIRSQAPKNSGI